MRSLRGLCVALTLVACGKSDKPKITVMGSGAGSGSTSPATEVADASMAVTIDAPMFGRPVATKIFAGGATTCALLPDATVKCWGDNRLGQLGDGTTTTSGTTVSPKGLTGVKDLVVADAYACALKTDGAVVCWGRLGDLKSKPSLEPTPLPGVTGATRFVSDGCVAVADDNVLCWNTSLIKKRGEVAAVPELAKATAFMHDELATYADGTVKYIDDERRNGLLPSKLDKALEVQVHGSDDVFCGRFDNGAVKCFGFSMRCKLGLPDAIMTKLPGGEGETPFTTDLVELKLPPAKELALDLSENLCIVTSENKLQCVDVGDVSGTNCGRVRSALLESVQFVTGNCAVLMDGSVNCVSVDKRRRMMVTAISGSTGVTQIASSYSHTCALSAAGVFCWGANDHGQLGQGTVDKAPPKEDSWKPVTEPLQVKL